MVGRRRGRRMARRARSPHVIDQMRTTVGEIVGVSASLPRIVERAWTVEDGYVVHFRTAGGQPASCSRVAADRGPMLFAHASSARSAPRGPRATGSAVADATAPARSRCRTNCASPAPEPPPADLLVTAYDLLHSFGIDYGPYVRLCEHFLARIEGRTAPAGPQPATFVDGVANMGCSTPSARSRGGRWSLHRGGLMTGVAVVGRVSAASPTYAHCAPPGFDGHALVGRDPENGDRAAKVFEVPRR